MTIQTDSLELNISSLKSQLDREQFLLSEYTKTRCFFRDGKEICVTIANEVDINNTRKKIESLTNQLSNAKINLDNFLNPVIINESNLDPESNIIEILPQSKLNEIITPITKMGFTPLMLIGGGLLVAYVLFVRKKK